ncbi:YbaB/EbfC family nucleoid-associated protein [Listeria rocourtiae]|uniref:YbaB/EbfC family nucleoid-associated protein n=1 Tax=Listeria rocourtiae TaxID=647910 RepID=UPI0016251518|nr:YbaB/EbfC family nucleoid-associated protein [Listeria rocourtiae]MBC1435222.1 YbaB/EbfC family nucleoid-associated protein [Listeria rocourtiae]
MRGMGNMQGMMKQMQKMQKEMAKAQAELEERSFTGTAGGGMVTVEMTGKRIVTDVVVKEEVVDPEDIEMLQDLILAATNDALKQVEDTTASTMGKFTQGMNLPGM